MPSVDLVWVALYGARVKRGLAGRAQLATCHPNFTLKLSGKASHAHHRRGPVLVAPRRAVHADPLGWQRLRLPGRALRAAEGAVRNPKNGAWRALQLRPHAIS